MRATLDLGQLDLKLTAKQTRWVMSLVPNTALIGGFGSGKTMPFCLKAIYLSILNGNGYSGLLVSPTYKMFTRILLPTFRDDIMGKLALKTGVTLWDASVWSKSEQSLRLPWGFTYYFGSADRGALRHRGTNLAVVGVDEATLIPDFSSLVISLTSRLRKARSRPDGGFYEQFFVDGTPEGLDAIYEKWCIPPVDPDKRAKWEKNHEIIRISTVENPGVSPEFVERLKQTMSEEQARAYIFGEHIDIGRGLAYYCFNQESNVRKEAVYDPNLDLHISWDFNISPMSMSISQVVGDRRLLRTVDEISLKDSNTPEVCREFIRRYGSQGLKHSRDIYLYGDASAKVGTNQYDEIEDWLRPAFRGQVHRRVPAANPKHSSRLKAVNALLRNAKGEVRWVINPKCVALLGDLKMQRMDIKKPSMKDKAQVGISGLTLGHMADTADYVIDRLFPYRRKDIRSAMSRSRLLEHQR